MKPEIKARLAELIGTALGAASMCWDEIPTGVFDSTRASAICDSVLHHLEIEFDIIGRSEVSPGTCIGDGDEVATSSPASIEFGKIK